MDHQGTNEIEERFVKDLAHFVTTCSDNHVSEQCALERRLVGMRMFDNPIVRFAAADDEGFAELSHHDVVGPAHLKPSDWLTGAQTVISLFFPLTRKVRLSNRHSFDEVSNEWLHARIEGQKCINQCCAYAVDLLRSLGFEAVHPATDVRFCATNLVLGDNTGEASFRSNWSERHVAYVCGMGTFSLSKNMITEAGVAGRLASLVTTAPFAPTPRPYTDIDEYCTQCGACIRRCPAQAISARNGKDNRACSDFLERVGQQHLGYYGCGKCQVGVPCESSIPRAYKMGLTHRSHKDGH